ncbi:hypothetical protein [Streptomyces sp. CA2R106]|uniref:hypothetical protein n=1 Tax=Streptomyces sp. CA2R106 TaxID=3120153 RepID=UPI00300B1CAF
MHTDPAAAAALPDGRVLSADGGLPPALGDDFAQAVAAVAALLQEDVMERTWRVWPVCAADGVGLHPVVREGDAVWWCAAGGGHEAAVVGGLGAGGRQA